MSIFSKCGIKNCFWNDWLAWSVFWYKCAVMDQLLRWPDRVGEWNTNHQPLLYASFMTMSYSHTSWPYNNWVELKLFFFYLTLHKLVCLTVDQLFAVFLRSCRVLKLVGLDWKQVEISLRLFFIFFFIFKKNLLNRITYALLTLQLVEKSESAFLWLEHKWKKQTKEAWRTHHPLVVSGDIPEFIFFC